MDGSINDMNSSIVKPTLVAIGQQMVRDTTPPTPPTTPTTTENENSGVNGEINGNDVDVEIEPVTKGNQVELHLCSCSLILNCFNR